MGSADMDIYDAIKRDFLNEAELSIRRRGRAVRVVIFGGRNFTNQILAFKALDQLHEQYGFTVVIDGMAKGADSIGNKWAQARGLQTERYPANWSRYGRAAGPIRNQQMIDDGKPDIGVAFPGGTGTDHMKSAMKKAGIKVRSVIPKFV